MNPISAGLGVGSLLFGMGDRERQKTRDHQAAMLQAEQTRMSPWLQGDTTASTQAQNLTQKQESPMGALAAGSTSLWAQLQQDKMAEEMATRSAAKSALEDRYMEVKINQLEGKPWKIKKN